MEENLGGRKAFVKNLIYCHGEMTVFIEGSFSTVETESLTRQGGRRVCEQNKIRFISVVPEREIKKKEKGIQKCDMMEEWRESL